MRKLLVLAILLYDIMATRTNSYDYDDGTKHHAVMDDRRNWRKKMLSKTADQHRDWERKRYEYDHPKYTEDVDPKNFNGIDRQREMDLSSSYKHRRSDDEIGLPMGKSSSEIIHSSLEKVFHDKRVPLEMNCGRQHERFESCFAGCASVSCDNPRDRMQPCYPFCEAGCVCVHPYVRDDRTHKCVLPEECTKGLKGIPDLGEDSVVGSA